MLGDRILKSAYRLSGCLSATSLGDLDAFRRLRRRARGSVLRLLSRDNVMLAQVDGLPLYIYASRVSVALYLLRPYEPFTTELFKDVIRPGATVLDIGAQYGYFSLVAARQVGPRGKVYAFEPVPANFELLQRNIGESGYGDIIRPVPKAVGEQHGERTMFLYEESGLHSMHRHPQASVRQTVSVECVTIDEFLAGQPVDVIKMDIEGTEPFALKGMEQTIARSGSLVLFAELAPVLLQQAGVTPHEYLEQLQRLGFEAQLIDDDSHCLKHASSWHGGPSWTANLYCKRKDNWS